MSSILCIQLVKIVYQRVLLAQCYGVVQKASADYLHHPLDLQAGELHLALAKPSEDTSVADLDSCARAASALHPGRVDDAVTMSLPKHIDKRGFLPVVLVWLHLIR